MHKVQKDSQVTSVFLRFWDLYSTYSFYVCAESKSVKKTGKLSVFLRFRVLRSQKLRVNMLVKSTPGVNFINILRAAFAPVDPKSVKGY